MKQLTAFILASLSIFASAQTLTEPGKVRALIVTSDRFISAFANEAKAQERIAQEVKVLNDSLLRQAIPLQIDIVDFKKLNLANSEFDPNESCYELTNFLSDRDTSESFASIPSLREQAHADLVILMLNSKSGLLKESQSYGLLCSGIETDDGDRSDDSYVFVDKLGLETLTLPHEVGHFLGAGSDHEFAEVGKSEATLMIANGNKQKRKRIPYWSDAQYVYQGQTLKPRSGTPDVDVIRSQIPTTLSKFADWMKTRKK